MKKRCTLSQLTSLVGACPIARGRVPGMAFTHPGVLDIRGRSDFSTDLTLARRGPTLK